MAPATYSKEQIDQYLERIFIPKEFRMTSLTEVGNPLEYLKTLQRHHLVAIPFENLSLHYGPGIVNLQIDALFNKIVKCKGRGGYCMENNYLFGTLLRSLGYQVYSAGARVHEGSSGWSGFSHMVNLVTIAGQKYHVDVGFGRGPIQPLRLNKDAETFSSIKPGSHRLVWRNIDANTDPDQRLWVLEFQKDRDSKWNQIYCFTELEFLAADYAVMNHYTSTSRHTFFPHRIVCVRMFFGHEAVAVGAMTRADYGDYDDIVGMYIINATGFSRSVHGESISMAVFSSDKERLEALEKYFYMKFTDAEEEAIEGLPSAIGPGPDV